MVEQLEDVLEQFPLSSVIRSHAELTEQALDAWSERLRDLGSPGRKYWDHPAELMYDEVGVLLGAMFVLIQAAITETVSIVKRVFELNGQTIGKEAVMKLEADINPDSGLSCVAIANGAANFYKHRFEWPEGWLASGSRGQNGTINIVRAVGMRPAKDLADNLLCAVRALARTPGAKLKSLSDPVVGEWRARLALRLRAQFALNQYP